ncbi:MAG: HAMP domain-containing histidine kinase [bacterium]|nr:HAMP domain-containing histidine kinase [bacterium]
MPGFTRTLAFRISGLFLLLLFISGGGFWLWLGDADIAGDMAADEEAWYQEKAEGELDDLAKKLVPSVNDSAALTRRVENYGRDIFKYSAEIIVFDKDGQYLTSSQPDSLGHVISSVNPQLIHDMSSGTWDYNSYPLPDHVDAYENRIFEVDRLISGSDADSTIQGYLVANFRPTTISLTEIAAAEKIIGINAIALLLLYSALCGLVIMLWTSRRIRNLNIGVTAFSEGQLDTRLAINSSDELGSLGRNFNNMAGNIESMMDKLRDKEQFQRQLIANISHDLRTPMASMRGYVETLSLQSKTMSDDDRERYLGIITSNIVHLDKLIDHMLILSRFDSGQATLRMENFPLGELADSVLMRCEGLAAERNIELDLLITDTDTLVHADPLQIAQVLQNLVENGIKFNSASGKVNIHLSCSNSLVNVAVEDTGLGISSEDLPHIFERFYTADKSRTRAVDGSGMAAVQDHLGQSSGLGLAIASKIVAGHNSLLKVESKVSQGTTFTFSLKAASEMEQRSQKM